ncbi:hypothetical protein EDF60_2492 [Leucobacter luti]|nr:hypothetical protein [Leucobacter luti]TCK40031.1 hypothetical protein EDF60_2492 [Leucobacter luti]
MWGCGAVLVGFGVWVVGVGWVVWCGWFVKSGGFMRGRARDVGVVCGWGWIHVIYSLVTATEPGSEAEAERSGL